MYREVTFTHEIPEDQLSERAKSSRKKWAEKMAKQEVHKTVKVEKAKTKQCTKHNDKKKQERCGYVGQGMKELQTAQSSSPLSGVQTKFYAVTRGWQTGVYDDYMTVDRVIRNFKGAEYRIFDDYIEACDYVRNNQMYSFRDTKHSKLNREDRMRQQSDKALRVMYCRSCGKPIKIKNDHNKGLCPLCLKLPKQERGKYQIDSRKTHYNEEIDAPQYIYDLLGEAKEFIKIDGSKQNPTIYYRCKRCGEDFAINYESLKKRKGHDCEGVISSGESIIKDYLEKNGIPYKTQYDTLCCTNPITNHPLPYDFELTDDKTIIEVQGEQHRKYIKKFHGTEEGFEYQKYKDTIKKVFALSKGYTYLEIWYNQIESGEYKALVDNICNNADSYAEETI